MFNEYLFQLCDCTCSNVMCVCSIAWWSNPKIFLSILFASGSDFFHFNVEIFFSKCQILCVEKLCVWSFCDSFRKWFQVTRFLRNFNFLKISSKEFHYSLESASWLSLDPRNSALCICIFHERQCLKGLKF